MKSEKSSFFSLAKLTGRWGREGGIKEKSPMNLGQRRCQEEQVDATLYLTCVPYTSFYWTASYWNINSKIKLVWTERETDLRVDGQLFICRPVHAVGCLVLSLSLSLSLFSLSPSLLFSLTYFPFPLSFSPARLGSFTSLQFCKMPYLAKGFISTTVIQYVKLDEKRRTFLTWIVCEFRFVVFELFAKKAVSLCVCQEYKCHG